MKVIVIGDIMLDIYNYGDICRISPEAPVPIFEKKESISRLGGALNVAYCFYKLGDDVIVFGRTGCDENLLKPLIPKGIKTKFIKNKNIPLTKKTRIISNNTHILRIDEESKKYISSKEEIILLNSINKIIDDYDAIAFSDYNKGFITQSLINKLTSLCQEKKKITFLDPKFRNISTYNGIDIIKANKSEASHLSEINIVDKKSLKKSALKIYDNLNLDMIIITLSEDGCFLYDGKNYIFEKTYANSFIDVTGAGDTFFSSFISEYITTNDLLRSLKFASFSSALCLEKIGCYAPLRKDIYKLMNDD